MPRHFVRDPELAQDVVQETFLQLCRQPDGDLQERVAPWLFKVCRFRAIDLKRKESRMRAVQDELLVQPTDETADPTASLEQQEAVDNLQKQISRLPDSQQEVLRLKFQTGLSYQEIADVTGKSRTNVGFLLHTAIKKLRERIV